MHLFCHTDVNGAGGLGKGLQLSGGRRRYLLVVYLLIEKLQKRALVVSFFGCLLSTYPRRRANPRTQVRSSSELLFFFLVGRVCHPDALSGTCGGMSFAKKLLFGVSRLVGRGLWCLRVCAHTDHRLSVCVCAAHHCRHREICLPLEGPGGKTQHGGKRKWQEKKVV